MIRPLFTRLLLALAVVLQGSCSPSDPTPDKRRPNIIWITIDTLRARDLEVYGSPLATSPHLSRFAAGGAVIENGFAQSPWTKPSVASMFSSVRPHGHWATSESTRSRLAGPLETIAEVLQGEGYRTAGFSENPHIQSSTGFGQGFEYFAAPSKWGSGTVTETTLKQAQEWIRAPKGDASFFCYVQVLDPHDPYSTTRFRDDFVEGSLPENPDLRGGRIDMLQERGQLDQGVTPEELALLKQLYDAEIRAVDEALGAFLDTLESSNQLANTIVLITSDHGEEFLEHGGVLHGYHLFDEAVHVPIILRGPQIEPGRIGGIVVEHVDLAPTLLELVGLDAEQRPPSWVGSSFAGALRGDDPVPDPELAEAVTETQFRERNLRSIRSLEWKLIHDLRADTYQLYDLEADPAEKNDVLAQFPEVAQALAARMQLAFSLPPAVSREQALGEADSELQSQLRDIGYVDDGPSLNSSEDGE